jgi:hypothetical protein
MNVRRLIAGFVLAVPFAGCGGGGNAGSPAAPGGPASGQTVTPTFRIVVPAKTAAANRKPQYVGAGTQSVTVTLDTVNAGPPPAGLVTTATTNIAAGSCSAGCTVNGPSVPPGTDAFSVTTFDGTNATGNQIATTPTPQSFTIVAGAANGPFTITLDGIPKTFTFGAVTGGAAGTTSTQTLSIAVLDADGNTITGTYANPVTLSDSDSSGDLVNGSAVKVGAGAAATSVTLNSDTDAAAATLTYGGLAIVSPTLSLSAMGATTGTQPFSVTLNPITVAPATEIDLYAATGTGSTGSFTAGEVGWSNAPYNKTFTLGTATCSTGTAAATYSLSTVNNLTWTDTTPASPAAGNCTVPINDFAGSLHSGSVTLTFTTGAFRVN